MGEVADGPAAVGNDFVYEADYDGNVYAFQIGCATAGHVCYPSWYGNVGEGGPRTPAVADGLVYIGSQNGDLFAFKAAGCGASNEECPPVWRAVTRRHANILSTPAVGDGLVFVTNYADGYLYAYPERCGSPCAPTWLAFLSKQDDSSPVVANGVVYAAEGNEPGNVGIDAFSTRCADHGGTCAPLWHGNGGSYYVPSGPSIADGELWATGGQEGGPSYLYAFGLPVPSGRSAGTARTN
jgi:outer membrane protein assembly factor BamB